MIRDIEIVFLLMLGMIVLLLVLGFDALIQRTTPRVIYVHSGGRDDEETDSMPAAS